MGLLRELLAPTPEVISQIINITRLRLHVAQCNSDIEEAYIEQWLDYRYSIHSVNWLSNLGLLGIFQDELDHHGYPSTIEFAIKAFQFVLANYIYKRCNVPVFLSIPEKGKEMDFLYETFSGKLSSQDYRFYKLCSELNNGLLENLFPVTIRHVSMAILSESNRLDYLTTGNNQKVGIAIPISLFIEPLTLRIFLIH